MAGELPTGITISPAGAVAAAQGQPLYMAATFTVTGTNDGDPDPWTNDLQWYYAQGEDASSWTALGDQVDDVDDTVTYYGSITPGATGPYFVKATIIHTDPNEDPDVVTTFDSNVLRVHSFGLTEKVHENMADNALTGLTPREAEL